MDEKGYIQFRCHHIDGAAPKDIPDLIEVRNELFQLGLFGMYENGIGFGNISARTVASDACLTAFKFIISGTQTGGLETLGAEHFTTVERFDIEQNELWCRGPVKASSESLSHAAVYLAQKEAQAVIHFHSLPVWNWALKNLPCTEPSAEAGTVEMAHAIQTLLKNSPVKFFGMAGHKEGMIAWGTDIRQAFNEIKTCLNSLK